MKTLPVEVDRVAHFFLREIVDCGEVPAEGIAEVEAENKGELKLVELRFTKRVSFWVTEDLGN